MSVFTNVELGPPVVIFALNKACLDDKFPKKVNLTIGGKFYIKFIDLYGMCLKNYINAE